MNKQSAIYTERYILPRPAWSVQEHGVEIRINDYETMPTATLISLDLETNGIEVNQDGFKIVCIGISDGATCWVYYEIKDQLVEYLRSVQFIAHEGKRAEIPWLNKVYGGFSIEQLAFDTYTMAYTFDSTRKKYGLKKLLEDILGIQYPTYSEIISDPYFVEAACNDRPELLIQKTVKVSKKNPNGVVINKLPKELTLDKMPQWVVAEYNSCDTYWTWKLYEYYKTNYNAKHWSFFNTIEMPTTRLIHHMEQLGIKIDTKAVRRIHNGYSKKRRMAARQFFKLAGEAINLSSPKQVLSLLQANGIDVQSTGVDALAAQRGLPLIEELFKYREADKVCTTYTRPLYFNAARTEDSRIHARFNQNTITGRLSSSDPINLQNQPQAVREVFVAKEGHEFVNADFSNIELRLPAHFSGEQGFLDELSKRGGDLHTRTANFIFGTDIVLLPEEERKEKRNKAKTCNFLLTNSGTAKRLASELNVEEKEAEDLYRRFWQSYPTMAAWLREEKFQARRAGGIETYFGRWVSLPALTLWCGNNNCAKTNRFCKTCFVREEAEREAISIRVQGTAADLMKLSMIRLYQEHGVVANATIHDELLVEVPIDSIDKMMYTIKEVMENVVQMKVPIIADVGHGRTWASSKGK